MIDIRTKSRICPFFDRVPQTVYIRNLQALMLVICVIFPPLVLAANFCATTSAELEADLIIAAQNTEDDFIKLAPGVFTPSGDAFVFDTTDPHGLAISGGFVSQPGAPCSVQLLGARWSVIDGLGTKRLIYISLSGSSGNPALSLDNMTLQNGLSKPSGITSAVYISDIVGGITDVMLTSIHLRNTQAYYNILAIETAGRIIVRNSVFSNNSFSNVKGEVIYLGTTKSTSGTAVTFDNNTVSGSHSPATSTRSGLSIVNNSSQNVVLNNNIFWNNGIVPDIAFYSSVGSGKTYLDSNDIQYFYNSQGVSEINHLNVDPGFIGNGDLHLSIVSPLRDAGSSALLKGAVDADGYPRIVYGKIDLGAYEFQDAIFKDSVELPY